MNKAYLFEAHTIQPYILEGGKLSEMVGASEILEELVGKDGPLDIVLAEMGLVEKDDFVFARRGGGAFYLLFNDANNARRLMEVWALIVGGFAPGLQYVHACGFEAGTQREAIEQAKASMREQRKHLLPELPEAGPWIRRSPRTGKPAQAIVDGIWIDRAAEVKQLDRFAKGKTLGRKFLNQQHDAYEFPRHMDLDDLKPGKDGKLRKPKGAVFPFNRDNRNIGIIHADGNGLEQILIKLAKELKQSNDYAKVFNELSEKIDTATQKAARRALASVIAKSDKKVIPARPLILGGDDLTMIVRADLALEYARDFISFFESETEKELAPLHRQYPGIVPKQMTACAGVAFLRFNQPFSFGYALAESLSVAAKTQSRKCCPEGAVPGRPECVIPGSLAFHRVTSSFIDEYGIALERELTAKHSGLEIQKTLGAYGAGRFADQLPSFDVLEKIKNLFIEPNMARGPARHFLTLVSVDPMEAADAWRRWRKNMDKNAVLKEALSHYDDYAAQLRPGFTKDSPFVNDNAEPGRQKTFIGDLINWMAAAGEGEQ